MAGLIIIKADGTSERRPLETVPDHVMLHDLVGGYIELVPHWNHVTVDGKVQRCAVFCDENGKVNGRPINKIATGLWYSAINGIVEDYLVGDIVIVWGNKAFISRL